MAISLRALGAIFLFLTAQLAFGSPAPVERASNPRNRIVDPAGRVLYMVDLRDDAVDGFSNTVPPAVRARFASRHAARAVNVVANFEDRYGFLHRRMTSWVGYSFSAFLTEAQVNRIRSDPLVELVTESVRWVLSASPVPPWQDSSISLPGGLTEVNPWGRIAVRGAILDPAANVVVYVVGGGFGSHGDLPITRQLSAIEGVSPVGCYSHATHVAGIIGAIANNGGVIGVASGANVVSISAATSNRPAVGTPVCGDPGSLTSDAVAAALDVVRSDMPIRSPGVAGVVNMSINSSDGSYSVNGSVNAKMAALTVPNPATGFAGVFIAQSAGNNWADACAHAYSVQSHFEAGDGIMVVGGVDQNGMMVQPPNPSNENSFGFVNQPNAANERGSNYGPCVEVWAPSTNVFSTWGNAASYDPNIPSTWQRSDTVYYNYISLSGTSMAAPHVSGLAAAILAKNNTLTPAQVEGVIREQFFTLGQLDQGCTPACVVNLVALPAALFPLTAILNLLTE